MANAGASRRQLVQTVLVLGLGLGYAILVIPFVVPGAMHAEPIIMIGAVVLILSPLLIFGIVMLFRPRARRRSGR